jgi:nitrogen regulatory protein P-II 2
MKMIVAMIQPHQLPAAKKALFDAGVHKMTVTNVVGCGQQKGYSENYRGVVQDINLVKKVRLEIAVNDEFVDTTVNAIVQGAKTGRIGDGKIFVSPLEQCIRIRTEEKGSEAIG